MAKEIWKDVQGYEGQYQISSLGGVKSLRRTVKNRWGGDRVIEEKIRKFQIVGGYYQVQLSSNWETKHFYVHKLLALHFIPNPGRLPQINHIDGVKLNNSLENLEWCTQRHNTIHAYKTGLARGKPGSGNSQAVLSETIVKEIFETKGHFSTDELAKKHSVHRITIEAIFRGDTWNHVTGLPKPERDENRRLLKKRRYNYITRKETNCRNRDYSFS